MEYKNYNGHTYYGELISIKDILQSIEDGGENILCNNSIQNEAADELLNDLLPVIEEGFVDCDEDSGYGDCILFKVKEDCYKALVKIVAEYKPDEFDEANENYFRMWWD